MGTSASRFILWFRYRRYGAPSLSRVMQSWVRATVSLIRSPHRIRIKVISR